MLVVGQSASFTKKVTENDINAFAEISGDFNPVHMNEEAGGKSIFGGRIAHGMLSASFISAVLGTYLPGEGTIYLSQNLQFTKPVYIGDEVTAKAEVVEIINPEKGIYKIKTQCFNQKDEMVIDGEAVVKYLN
ncbi:MAG: MaoC family dehydratase [Lachnospiraceae bacterium]|nr:MaoC family dehydratase [Lachnospiraceae bacterium]